MWRFDRTKRTLRKADQLRDRRLWHEAAIAYEAVLKDAPKQSAIWVQYGHALKESGRVSEAVLAYKEALAIDPSPADSWLQLGHGLKLLGSREEAVDAYAAALKRAPKLSQAITEIVELAGSARARLYPEHGFDVLDDTVRKLAEVREALFQIERRLPPLSALNSHSPAELDEFQRLFRIPPPPKAATKLSCRVVLLPHQSKPLRLEETYWSLQQQIERPVITAIFGPESQHSHDLLDAEVIHLGHRSVLQVLWGVVQQSSEDYFVLAYGSTSCDRTTTLWFEYVFNETIAEIVLPDEVLSVSGEDGRCKSQAVFRESPTNINWRESVASASLIAIRRSTLLRCLAIAVEDSHVSVDAWLMSLQGRVVPCHLPRMLSRTTWNALPNYLEPASDASESVGKSSVGAASTGAEKLRRDRICLIVPTRNLGDYLQLCLSSARVTASERDLLEIIVVDNQSTDPETLQYLDKERVSGTRVLPFDEPFNWSRISNLAAHATRADILVFLNNDIEFRRSGWDDTLRHLFSDTSIRAVGARMLYPNDTIQHAGMVFRTHGLPEHEGRQEPATEGGPHHRWMRRRYVSAVTGAFLAVQARDFSFVGGFDEVNLPVWFSDVDLCLKLRSLGRIVYEPSIEVIHQESISIGKAHPNEERRKLWDYSAAFMEKKWGYDLHFDPGFNPHYASWGGTSAHIAEPSESTIVQYVWRAARLDPWRVALR